jgi:hypothetical protein
MRTLLVAALFFITRLAAAAPPNDDCSTATVIGSMPFSDSVDTTTATTAPGDPSSCSGGVGTHSVWYRIAAGAPRVLLRASKAGSTGSFRVRAFTGSCASLTPLICGGSRDDLGIAPQGQEVFVEVVNTTAAGGTLALAMEQLPEFLVSASGSRTLSVGAGPGGFLSVWRNEAGSFDGQLFSPGGGALGSPLALGTADQSWVDAAGGGNGSFVVVWDSQAARVDPPGVVQTLPDVVPGGYPRVAADADGDFVVVWEGADGSGGGIVGRRFDAAGTPLGGTFQVNTQTLQSQYQPAIAMAPGGEFVVVWTGAPDGDDGGIGGRLYDAGGVAQGNEFVVNSNTATEQSRPGVGMDGAGNFVVAWRHGGYIEPFDNPVMFRRFDASGTPLGDDFVVTTLQSLNSVTGHLDIATDTAGNSMVTWETHTYPTVDVAGRQFDAAGTPLGPQFVVNSFLQYAEYNPDVAATPDGAFMVVWNDFLGFLTLNNDEDAIVARVFGESGGCASAPLSGCRQPTAPLKSKLTLVNDADDFHDQFRWSWLKGAATDAGDFGMPTTDTSYSFCVYDPSSTLLFRADAPAGGMCGARPCWRGIGSPPGAKGFTYKDTARTPHGIVKGVYRPGAVGRAKITVSAGGLNVFSAPPGAPPLPLPLPARVQLQTSGGECWEATYTSAGVTANGPTAFKGAGS